MRAFIVIVLCILLLAEANFLCTALQDRYKALEAALAESQSQQAVSYQRQQDLEYELGRAWEELERAESSLQQQRAQQEVAVQQQESQLAQARQVGAGLACKDYAVWQAWMLSFRA